MPINYKTYPKNWNELRKQVLERAGNKCEHCGVENYSIVERNYNNGAETRTRIVLTIHHIDKDPENQDVSIDKLIALCQKCHLSNHKRKKK